jgi:hypothetical protein
MGTHAPTLIADIAALCTQYGSGHGFTDLASDIAFCAARMAGRCCAAG